MSDKIIQQLSEVYDNQSIEELRNEPFRLPADLASPLMLWLS